MTAGRRRPPKLGARKFDRSKVEAGVHVEVDLPVRSHVGPEQRGQAAPISRREKLGPLRFAEDVLEHQGVHEDQGRLQNPQAQDEHLLLVTPVRGDLSALAVGDDGVGAVGGLHDVQALLDLPLKVAQPQVAGHEDSLLCPSNLQHGRVGRVGSVAGESAQDCLGRRSPRTDRGRILDHLVVLLGDEFPADRAGQRRAELRVGVRVAGHRPPATGRYSLTLLIRLMRGSRSKFSSRVMPNPISDFMWTVQVDHPSACCGAAATMGPVRRVSVGSAWMAPCRCMK